MRVRVQPQQVGRVTDRGVLGGGGRVLEGGDEERNQNMKSESEEKLKIVKKRKEKENNNPV